MVTLTGFTFLWLFLWTAVPSDATRTSDMDSHDEKAHALKTQTFAHLASASSVAAELAAHLRSLGDREPHHVCVTGNAAAAAIDAFVLHGSDQIRSPYQMQSKISETSCLVEEAQMGNTLFTIAESLSDHCLPRWRVQSASCDVLFHAHSGGDCTELSKFRLVNDKCDADLLVVYDTEELTKCFDERMTAHKSQHPGSGCAEQAVWLSANDARVGHGVTEAIKLAVSKHAAKSKRKFSTSEGGEKASLRERLSQVSEKQIVDVQDEVLKASQGFPTSQGSFIENLHTIKKARSGDKAVVIDNGSGSIKIGYSGEVVPLKVFPNVVGKPKYEEALHGPSIVFSEYHVGENAQKMRGVDILTHPVQHGIIRPEEYEKMEQVWAYAFNDMLGIPPTDSSVLLTEVPQNPKANRDKMAETFFERMQVGNLYIAMNAVLTMYSGGRTTGLVVESGDGVTHIVPVYDGYALPHVIQRFDTAGADITDYMMKLLMERGQFRPKTTAEREIARDIKETHAYVAPFNNFEQEKKKAEEVSYKLPDGAIIKIKDERFRVAEPLFQPKMIGREHLGIHEAVFKAIQDCDIDIREKMYENIVVSGGNTMFPGFAERLREEVQDKAPDTMKVNVVASEERKYGAWIGGSILADLKSFKDMWITRQQYSEDGAGIVHTKCIY